MKYHSSTRINGSLLRGWNKTLKYCYDRGCRCTGCPIQELYFKYNPHQDCRCKVYVIETVRIYGKPEEK